MGFLSNASLTPILSPSLFVGGVGPLYHAILLLPQFLTLSNTEPEQISLSLRCLVRYLVTEKRKLINMLTGYLLLTSGTRPGDASKNLHPAMMPQQVSAAPSNGTWLPLYVLTARVLPREDSACFLLNSVCPMKIDFHVITAAGNREEASTPKDVRLERQKGKTLMLLVRPGHFPAFRISLSQNPKREMINSPNNLKLKQKKYKVFNQDQI